MKNKILKKYKNVFEALEKYDKTGKLPPMKMNKQKIIDDWIRKNGAASFDLKKGDIILHDGGLFPIEKKIKYRPRYKMVKIKEGKWKDCYEMKDIKGKKVKYEDYEAILWMRELDETINYLKRMRKMLNKIGCKTNYE